MARDRRFAAVFLSVLAMGLAPRLAAGQTSAPVATRWTAYAGAVFLTRADSRSQPLVFDGVEALVDSGDLHFNTEAGPDIYLLRHGPDFDLNVRYFQVDDVSAASSLLPPGTVDLLLNSPVSVDCPQLDITDATNLLSTEINFRQNVGPLVTLLAGFRYLSLRDDLRFSFDDVNDPPGLTTISQSTSNNLFGGQVGADAILWSRGAFQLQTAVEAGVYGNCAATVLDASPFGSSGPPLGGHSQRTAFVGDLNITGVYQFSQHWALRAGYQLLWISGVALAAEQANVGPQISRLQVPGGPEFLPDWPIATTGDVLFHGALVSLQSNW